MVSSSNHPEPLSLTLLELQAHPVLSLVKGGGKMHRLLRSAFKRGDSASACSGEEAADQLGWSASESSSLAASSGRTLSRRQASRRGGDDSYNSETPITVTSLVARVLRSTVRHLWFLVFSKICLVDRIWVLFGEIERIF